MLTFVLVTVLVKTRVKSFAATLKFILYSKYFGCFKFPTHKNFGQLYFLTLFYLKLKLSKPFASNVASAKLEQTYVHTYTY